MMRLAAVAVGLLIAWAVLFRPVTAPDHIPGPIPDSHDYAHGAEALLHGSYTVAYRAQAVAANGYAYGYDGTPRVPQYPPGMAILLAPLVAIGGVGSAVWLSYLSALALGALMIVLPVRLGRPSAAPIAVVLTLYTPAVVAHSRIVMSDLPAAAMVMLLAYLLVAGHTTAAGVLAGFLPVLRLASLPLLLAPALALERRRLVPYVLGTLPPLVLLGVWQWALYGSPLATGYSDSKPFARLFSLGYLFGPPAGMDGANLSGTGTLWGLPNALAYPPQLIGLDAFLSWPLVGLVGLAYLLRCRHAPFARFALAVVALSYLTYTPYYYQAGRFLMPAAALLSLGAALAVAQLMTSLKAKPARSAVSTE